MRLIEMKTKKNKKFYNFTDKQKRKDRSVKRDLPPASYRKPYNDEFDAQCKVALSKIRQGKEAEFPRFVKCVGWYYW